MSATAARAGATRQQQLQGRWRGRCGNTKHKSDAARTTGYCGDGGGGVDRDGGDKSGSTTATTTGYGGDGGGLQRKFGARLAPTSGNEKSI